MIPFKLYTHRACWVESYQTLFNEYPMVDAGAPEGWSGSFFQKGTFLLLLPTSPYPSLAPKQQGTSVGEWTRRLPQDTASSSGLEWGGLNPEHGGVNSLGKNVTPTVFILGRVSVLVTD